MREAIRVRHLAYSTEQLYVYYITGFIRFHGRKHPRELELEEVRAYLTDLAVNRNVSASTQNVAFSALLFLYKTVLDSPLAENIRDVKTTMVYTQVLSQGAKGVRSPLDS
ncbi:site-specific integrase [Meiothermus sp.]|uniref:site-specific integrase n=1 Tax=Meiothermus sp. TaxID=1955249 RepID=UPI0021DE2B60|nr:site-specific integrase [Meiothermus sp.]GIW35845.1 MAG: hypothetical protein KatS3mg072_3178 [Meiothermus sp.]